jgi:HPt (histidine-containing phosphotransfer) domain-containing protein
MNPMDPFPQAVLDSATVQQLLDLDDGSAGLLKEMYVIFRDDTPSRILALEAAIQTDNREEMGDVAHAIKGASATIGAPRVRALALALETAGRKGLSEEEPSVLLKRLQEEFQKALTALEAFAASKS